MPDKARYVYTPDAWGHIFDEGFGEVMTRWAYDTREEKLVGALVQDNRDWNPVSADELADLEDSVKDANADALDNPDNWDLAQSDELPDFIAEISSAHAITP